MFLESGSFAIGANLPWIDYGCDFGASAWFPDGGLGARPDALGRFDAALTRLAADGMALVRLFTMCDGRSGIETGAGGAPSGLDDAIVRDFDAALETATAHGIRLVPVLFDFHLAAARRVIGGVELGGRAAWMADPAATDLLIQRVVTPLAERYGRHPGIAAWDLFNEPEWCTQPFARWPGTGTALPVERSRAFLGALADAVRAEADQPVTVGSAGPDSLHLVRAIGLDFYQVHWYESMGWAALSRPVSRFDLDGPVLLGEFPGRAESAAPEAIVMAARDAGYAGALIWSALSRDPVSGYEGGLPLNL